MDKRSHCRTCLSKDCPLTPFNDDIKKKLEECISVPLEDEIDLCMICDNCQRLLQEFHTFKERFFAADNFFKTSPKTPQRHRKTRGKRSKNENESDFDAYKRELSLKEEPGDDQAQTNDGFEDDDIKNVDNYVKEEDSSMEGNEKYECTHCPYNRRFKTKKSQLRHVQKFHENHVNCPYCAESSSISNLLKHIRRMHANVAPRIKCETCAETFHVQTQLERHQVRAHTDACPTCDKRLTNVKLLQQHITYCKDRRLTKCPECERYILAKSLNNHLRSKHGQRDMCPTCGKKVIDIKSHSKQHVTRDKKLRCRYCGDFFRNLIEIYEHQSQVHQAERDAKERKYECHECGKRFAEPFSLSSHVRYSHLTVKAITCTVCGKVFKKKAQLVVHMRFHTNERRFTCGVCDKMFYANHKLKIHMRTHTGEKPYACGVCAKAFIRADYLKSHMKCHVRMKEASVLAGVC